MTFRERSSPLLSIDFGSLARYTRYPFFLLLPQTITERVLTEILESHGVKVLRPHTVTGMKMNENDKCVIDVLFDGGHVISARYVVGADGARSTVRSGRRFVWCSLTTLTLGPPIGRHRIRGS
jgi:2-polyprenyl-6-methoxyphenol hydroxylase-like FAD-dependent oxidoreductase